MPSNALSKGPIKSLSKISFHIHFKGQLRQVQKDAKDNIKDPCHHSTKSVSSRTIANDKLNEKPTQLLTDNLINTQIVETKDDCVTDIPKSPLLQSPVIISTHIYVIFLKALIS